MSGRALKFEVDRVYASSMCTRADCPCRRLGARRLREVLHRLMAGDGEKQAAVALGIARSTVHQYVSSIYAHFGVGSRAELLARVLPGLVRAESVDVRPNDAAQRAGG